MMGNNVIPYFQISSSCRAMPAQLFLSAWRCCCCSQHEVIPFREAATHVVWPTQLARFQKKRCELQIRKEMWRGVSAAGNTACVRCLLFLFCRQRNIGEASCVPAFASCVSALASAATARRCCIPSLRNRCLPYVASKGQCPLRPHWIPNGSHKMLLERTSRH